MHSLCERVIAPVFSVWGSYCPCHLFMKELLSLISMYLFRAYLTCLRLPLLSVSPYTLIGSPIALITCKKKKDQYQMHDVFIYTLHVCIYRLQAVKINNYNRFSRNMSSSSFITLETMLTLPSFLQISAAALYTLVAPSVAHSSWYKLYRM